MGWVGVDLFFVLSGFLISGLLFAEYKGTGGIAWKRFFIRRGLKIYPAFYCMIAVTFLYGLLRHVEFRVKPYLPEIFFYQSYQSDRLWPHTWSLAVEEHFYIVLPALLLLLISFYKPPRENPFRLIPVVWVTIAVACLLRRFYLAEAIPRNLRLEGVLFPSHLRIDSLFFGALLGYLYHFCSQVLASACRAWSGRILFVVSALLVSTCFFFPVDSVWMLSFGLTALYLGFGGFLVLVMHNTVGVLPPWLKKLKLGDVAAYIGMYSYSIYLWHVFVEARCHGFINRFWPSLGETAGFWFYVFASLAVGILLSRLIEFPILKLRDRLLPSVRSAINISAPNCVAGD